jgi:hypothetical protein
VFRSGWAAVAPRKSVRWWKYKVPALLTSPGKPLIGLGQVIKFIFIGKVLKVVGLFVNLLFSNCFVTTWMTWPNLKGFIKWPQDERNNFLSKLWLYQSKPNISGGRLDRHFLLESCPLFHNLTRKSCREFRTDLAKRAAARKKALTAMATKSPLGSPTNEQKRNLQMVSCFKAGVLLEPYFQI